MNDALSRSDSSRLGHWWWTVDRWTLAAIALLMGIGILLIQAATPAVAVKHDLNGLYFVQRHIAMLAPALFVMIALSLLTPRQTLTVAIALLIVFTGLLMLTPFIGTDIKGAQRWLSLPGFSLQPSEFVKPMFTVVAASLFARHAEKQGFPGVGANIALYALIVLCLLSQPDIGMTVLLSLIWFGQFFLAGLSLTMVGVCMVMAICALFGAYYTFPHFASRIDRFLSHSGDTYQVDKALDAFTRGGLLGTGPGEGSVKLNIPDAHADFIFAVAGEELGLIFCLLVLGLYAFIALRGFLKLRHESNLFILLAASGLLAEFGLQAAINLSSTLRLMPAKGMTLPFLSYGGSSLWAMAMAMGMLLALTRKRYGLNDF